MTQDRRTTPPRTASGSGEGFLPDFCNGHNVFLVVVGAEFLSVILTLAQGFGADFWTRLSLVSLFIQWVALGSVAALCYARERLNRLDTLHSALIAYVTILAITLLFSLLSMWVIAHLGLEPGGVEAAPFVARNLIISAIVTALILRYFYIQYQWKKNMEAEARSRVQALQARIRPHFLFNSMNTIASLTRSNPDQAEQAVEDLADLFRVSLASRNFLTLAEEINITKRYLSIEKHRLGDRLKVEWQIDEDIDERTEIPALMLQPLVENALYHGIEPLTEGGTVHICIRNLPNAIEIKVANPLGARSDQQRHKGNRMAQENIRQRLQLAYGDEGKLNIQATEERYIVSFKIPR